MRGASLFFSMRQFQTLIDRCLRQEQEKRAAGRPLLPQTEIARERYEERRVLYAKHAPRIIDVADGSPEIVAQAIGPAIFAMEGTPGLK
jgi:shikimate kinase